MRRHIALSSSNGRVKRGWLLDGSGLFFCLDWLFFAFLGSENRNLDPGLAGSWEYWSLIALSR